MKRKLMVWAVIFFVTLFVAGIVKDQIIKSTVTVVTSNVLGAPVHIDGFSLGILTQTVGISGFKIYNPKGFSNSVLIDLPKIKVKYDVLALLKKKIHIIEGQIEIKEMGLEKNKDKKLNVDSLKVVADGQKKSSDKGFPQMPIQIDVLSLNIGQVVSRDYSVSPGPSLKVYDININKTYKNISSIQELALLIMSEPMKAAGIQGATIYGAMMFTGAGFIPVAVASTIFGKNNAKQEYIANLDYAYNVSLEVLKKMGRVTQENKAKGLINAEVNGVSVRLELNKTPNNKTQIIVFAKKMMLPKPEVASGVIYEISKKLK